MIQPQSRLRVADNTGARTIQCIRIMGRSRSSRATGPKMRVPRGFPWLLMSTAAFSSKRM